MKQTLEVRWFREGLPPPSVRVWFETYDPAFESERTDRYLIGGDPSLNVKLRGGRLELKRRVGPPEPIRFRRGFAGTRERWHKWSFPLASAPNIEGKDPRAVWRPVYKRRSRRSYSPAEQAALVDALTGEARAAAHIELTVVETGPHTAWTLCIEAEGPSSDLGNVLQHMGTHLLDRDGTPALRAGHSFGYVQWLERCYPELAGGTA